MPRPSQENVPSKDFLRFFFDCYLDLRGDVAEHLDGHGSFTNRLERLAQLHLALIDLEALRRQRVRNIRRRHGSEHLIVLAGLARELDGNAIEQLGLLLRGLQLRGGFLGQRGANALDGFQVARRGLNGQLLRQKEIARVAGLHGDHVPAMPQLLDVFLKNDLHVFSLSSYSLMPWALPPRAPVLPEPALVSREWYARAWRGPALPAQPRAALACPPRCPQTAATRCYARA